MSGINFRLNMRFAYDFYSGFTLETGSGFLVFGYWTNPAGVVLWLFLPRQNRDCVLHFF